jgi:hypothetical protein
VAVFQGHRGRPIRPVTARAVAARALGAAGETAKAAVPALIQALDDGDSGVRGGTARALGRIGETAQAAVPALMQALDGGCGCSFESRWCARRDRRDGKSSRANPDRDAAR